MQEVLDGDIVSALIPNLLSSGQFFRAYHYWLLLVYQSDLLVSLRAQQSLIMACQRRNAWQQARLILEAMLHSQVREIKLSLLRQEQQYFHASKAASAARSYSRDCRPRPCKPHRAIEVGECFPHLKSVSLS